jgi:hypothetical protein
MRHSRSRWSRITGAAVFVCLLGESGAEFQSCQPLAAGEPPRREVNVTGICPDPDTVEVTITQPVPDGADAAELVTVAERVLGITSDVVTPENDGVTSDIVPTGMWPNGTIGS